MSGTKFILTMDRMRVINSFLDEQFIKVEDVKNGAYIEFAGNHSYTDEDGVWQQCSSVEIFTKENECDRQFTDITTCSDSDNTSVGSWSFFIRCKDIPGCEACEGTNPGMPLSPEKAHKYGILFAAIDSNWVSSDFYAKNIDSIQTLLLQLNPAQVTQ